MANDVSANKGFQFVLPADSLRDGPERTMAHVVVIAIALSLFLVLVGALTLMSVIYWGG